LEDATGEHIRKSGNEFGSTTGRPRRCGWLDLPALRYAVMINGITELAMMKADVLNGMDTVRICTHYRVNGSLTDRMPYDITSGVEPVYEDMPGWGDQASGDSLPDALERYTAHIEQTVGVPITLVSMGPDRAETVLRNHATVQ
jgi:adenylosuccinate synthase